PAPASAFGRPAAAGRGGARDDREAAPDPRRRTDRQPALVAGARDHGAVHDAQQGRHHDRAGDALRAEREVRSPGHQPEGRLAGGRRQMMDSLRQDVRYAVRQLWRAPAFTVAAVATLALGICANTALFTLGQAMLIRPLTVVLGSEQLMYLTGARMPSRFPTNMSYPDFLDYRAGLRHVAHLSVTSFNQFSLSGGTLEPERVRGEVVSGNYFQILRTPFALGRGFNASEDSVGSPR